MLDIGMTELLLIGIVALIVVGPKDLPGMFRTLGRFTAKARALGREFTRAMNDAADESGMKDAAEGLKAAANPKKFGMDRLNEAASNFEKWDPMKPSGKASDDGPKIADPEREADVAKIREATKKAGQAKLDAEKAAKEAADAPAEADATPAKKPAAKRATTAKAATAKKTPAKTTKPAPAKKPAAKKPAAKSTTAKPAAKTTTQKSTAAKPAAKKPAPKSSTAKPATAKAADRTTAKKTTARKTPAKKAASE